MSTDLTPIYLDYHATTPVDPRVFDAMKPYFSKEFGNPASGTHVFGWQAEEAVKISAEQVASLIHAQPKEIFWTSGTTESINLALKGVVNFERPQHMISCVTEHKAALETLKYLESCGVQVTYLPVDTEGLVDPDRVRQAIQKETVLISIMFANNEIGTIHPIAEIGKIAKEAGVIFHVDAAQACGKISVDVEALGIDLLSMSAHKVYGPKGIGALYVRSRHPHVNLTPQIHGGGHQGGMRGGTLAVQNIVGMGKSFEIAGQEMEGEAKWLIHLREKLWKGLCRGEPLCSPSKGRRTGLPLQINGHPTKRLPGNLNVSFSGIKASDLISQVREIALSSGSACTSGSHEPSYVLKALGINDELARGSIRFGLGRWTTEEEIDYVIEKMNVAVKKLHIF